MKVRDYMQRDPVCVTPEMPVPELTALLSKKQITGVPVVDREGKLQGVVSLSDVARETAKGSDPELTEYYVNPSWRYVELMEPDPTDKFVGEIMTKLVLDIEEEASLQAAAELLTNFRIHRVVVTRDKVVVGVLSTSDLVRAFLDVLKGKASV